MIEKSSRVMKFPLGEINMQKRKIESRIDASNFTKVFFVTMLLLISATSFAVSAGGEPFPAKKIFGTAQKCDGGSANGASVVVSASGYPDETITVQGGAWQVDIGPDSGTEWPDGTAFTVTITLGSWQGTGSGTVQGTYTDAGLIILDPPTLVATATLLTSGCIKVGDTVNFGGSATGGAPPYTWSWDFDDGGSSPNEDPSHVFTTEGTYNVELTVTDQCFNTDTDNVVVVVNGPLDCNAGGPYTGTVCNSVSFSGSASGGCSPYSYSWDFGDGGSGSGPSPSHQYTADGTYTATVTVTDDVGTIDTDTAAVTISTPALVADAGGPYTGTVCNSVSFSGSASGGCSPYSYSWDFGDGGSGSGPSPSHQYTADGTYTVTLTVTDDASDTDTDTAAVTISTTPLVAEAGGPYSGFESDPIDFFGSASGGCLPYSYSWNFGDGETGTGQSPSHSYDDPGTYTVTLTVTDDVGTTDIDTATCMVESIPVVADAGGPYQGCVGQAVQFSGSASGDAPPFTYNWDFGDGNSGSGQNPTNIYSAPGTYSVVLTVTDSNSNSDTDMATATIVECGEDPIANANGPYGGIVNQAVQFTGSAFSGEPPYSYEWDFGDGGSSTVQSPTHVYSSVGTYDVTLTVTDDDGKTDTDETTATISIGNPDLACAGSLSWKTKSQGTVTGSFTVSNVGDAGTNLDWEVDSFPDWGSWTFTPDQGDDLKPEDDPVTVEVTVVAPQEQQEFSGKVKLINKDNPSDFCEISVSMKVPKLRPYSPMLQFLQILAQRMPMLRMVLEIFQLI